MREVRASLGKLHVGAALVPVEPALCNRAIKRSAELIWGTAGLQKLRIDQFDKKSGRPARPRSRLRSRPASARRTQDRRTGDLQRISSIAHHRDRHPVPSEVRPHVGAALAADLADETMLYVGQAKVIRPVVATDGDGVATAVVRAIDQDAAHAHLAHFAERDLGRALRHLTNRPLPSV
jgi:hypothetical protein